MANEMDEEKLFDIKKSNEIKQIFKYIHTCLSSSQGVGTVVIKN